MKVELHCHTSRYSPCAGATPAELMERMVGLDYEAVYITEHNAVWLDEELEQLQAGFPEIRVYPGVELTVGDDWALHLLILGSNDPAYLRCRRAEEALERAADDGCLAILAHPFRWGGAEELLTSGVLPHALEYQTPNHSESELQQLASEAAESHGLPLVNSGDVHSTSMLQRFWIETDRPVHNARDIRRIVLNRHYVNCVGRGGRR
jgi:predicted metal-dependent phosphoesterase TrpH